MTYQSLKFGRVFFEILVRLCWQRGQASGNAVYPKTVCESKPRYDFLDNFPAWWQGLC